MGLCFSPMDPQLNYVSGQSETPSSWKDSLATEGGDLTPTKSQISHNRDFKPSVDMFRVAEPPVIESVWSTYIKDEVMGDGKSGKVFAVTKRDNGNRYALKRIDKANIHSFVREVNFLDTLDHPNILKLNRTWRDEKHFYIVTKLCEGGQLMQRIKKERFLSEKFAAEIIRSVCEVIAFIHSKNIVHQDIKPQNIAFDTKEPDSPVIILDWGESVRVNDDDEVTKAVGTPRYLAPETSSVRRGWELKKGDMWSLGITTYVLLTGRHPFRGSTKEQLDYNAKHQRVEFPPDLPLSKDAKQFILKCLRRNLKNRCSAEEALQMPWLCQASTQSNENIVSLISQNLTLLTNASKLQRLVLNVAVSQMSSAERQELKMTFERIDTKGDGRIDADELAAHFKETVPTLSSDDAYERAALIIRAVGSKTDNALGLKEFGRVQFAHQLFTREGMSAMYRSLSHGKLLNVCNLEEAFSNTFGREATVKEHAMLEKEFEKYFGNEKDVEEGNFVHQLRLKSASVDKDEMVRELFPYPSEEMSESSKNSEENQNE